MTEQPVVPTLPPSPDLWAGRIGLALNALIHNADEFSRLRLDTIREAAAEGWQRHLALTNEASDLLREVAEANAMVANSRSSFATQSDNMNRLRREFDRFKEEVRKAAIKAHQEEGWCIEGLNEALSDLGLDTYEREFVVSGRATFANREWSLTVTADDEASAKQIARDRMEEAEDDDSAWDGDLDICIDVQGVELAQ